MTIISFAALKGGVGKTTLAINITNLLNYKYPGDVILVDVDSPQYSSKTWVTRRNNDPALKKITAIKESGDTMLDTISDLKDKYKYIIIDAGGKDTDGLRGALVAADIVVVPSGASPMDSQDLDYVDMLISKATDVVSYERKKEASFNFPLEKRCLLVPNEVSTNIKSKMIDDFREQNQDHHYLKVSKSLIHNRDCYKQCVGYGMAIHKDEFNNRDAIFEMNKLYKEILNEE